MKRKTITYTSTLPNMVMEEVVEYAKKKKISKNKVIEIALKKLLDEEIRNELMESFKKIADDPEMIEMAEWGLGDYLEQLKNYEK
ncbi:MAG: CopG family transcriptional regulator [Chitinophagaceae bacterium]|nr:CopG family transcriptional regulator [Chitinophagaceae bacterium]